jgi:hypothetical protein
MCEKTNALCTELENAMVSAGAKVLKARGIEYLSDAEVQKLQELLDWFSLGSTGCIVQQLEEHASTL